LVVLAVGLAGYALWRVAQALSGSDAHEDKGAKAVLQRCGWAAVGGLYAFLCARAVSLALSSNSGGSSGGPSSHPQPWVAMALRWPAGPVWVGAAGLAAGAAGAGLAIWGAWHDYSKVIDVGRSGPAKLKVAWALGVAGEVVRGLLVVLVSAYLVSAAVQDQPSKAKSLGEALSSFGRSAPGPELLALAAVGLACFGLYSCFEALYRDVKH